MFQKKDFPYVVVVFYILLKSFTKDVMQNIDKYRKLKVNWQKNKWVNFVKVVLKLSIKQSMYLEKLVSKCW